MFADFMARFKRNPYAKQLKADSVALGVRSGERVMATGLGPSAYEPPVVIATDKALYFASKTEPIRLAWTEIAKAAWEEPWLTISTISGESMRLRLDPAGELPPVVRDRVTSSVLIRERVPLDIGGSVVCVGRRLPGSGEITWLIEFDQGVDPELDEIKSSADRALAELRSTLGV